MSLKFLIEDETDLPEDDAIKALYSQQSDGTWMLGVEGAVPKKRLDEFRKTNVALKSKLEKFDGIDPEEARDAIDRKAEFEAASDGASPEKIREAAEKIAQERLERIQATHEKQITKLAEERDSLRVNLNDRVLGDSLRKAGASQGLRPEAVEDLIARGKSVFSINDQGELVSIESDGVTPRLNERGDAFSPSDFVAGLVKSAPHLFVETKGSGASGSGSGSGSYSSSTPNPWAKETFNLTEQARIYKADPKKAAALAAKVGKTL